MFFFPTVQTEDFTGVRQPSVGAVVPDFLRQDHEGPRDLDRPQRQGRHDRAPGLSAINFRPTVLP